MLPIVMTIGDEDDKAFVDKIYRLYGKKIYLSALKILSSPEDAEDCLQDVIKTVIDRLELFQGAGEEQLIKLLVVCTRNTAIDLYRKKKKGFCTKRNIPFLMMEKRTIWAPLKTFPTNPPFPIGF